MRTLAIILIVFGFISCQKKESIYMRTAINAEKWIDANKFETPNGYYWVTPRTKSEKFDSISFYQGSPGVIVFYLELYNSTKEKLYLEKARKGADYLITLIPDSIDDKFPLGFYIGWSGVAYTLNETFKLTQDDKYKSAALKCISLIERDFPRKINNETLQDYPDIVFGSSGIGIYMLSIYKEMNNPQILLFAKRIGDSHIKMAISAENGYKWYCYPEDTIAGKYMPNFAHGTAGVSYFLARLYEETKDQKYLDASIKGANYLLSIANSDGLIYHDEPNGKDLYYLGWCHGPAGTARLFYKLNQLTNDAKWLDPIFKSADVIIKSGIPDTLTPGFWNNVGMCCGSSGLAEYYLNLYKIYNNDSYIKFVRKLTDNLISRELTDSLGTRWPQAEFNRKRDYLVAQVGYMQGAAGVGIWLLHLDAYDKGNKPIIKLPDVPF